MTKADWQGLTPKEIERLAIWADEHGHGPFHTDFALAIDRLLKEKNLCSDINQSDSAEPVAWEQLYPDIGKPQLEYLPASPFDISGKPQPKRNVATPREWVGLTGQQKNMIARISVDVFDAIHRTETKLKELNT